MKELHGGRSRTPALGAPRTRALGALLLAGAVATGCVFRDAAEPRFYKPESTMLDGGAGEPAPSGDVVLRLVPVNGTPFLRERIVWRVSEVEYGLYEQRLWTDLPARYVERALSAALRDSAGVRLTEDFHAPSLRVDLVAFDEVLAPAHVAAVAMVVSLRDGERPRLLDRTFTAEVEIAAETASASAVAMGRALDQVVGEVATAVREALRGRRPAR